MSVGTDLHLVGSDVLAREISIESGSVETVALVRRAAGERMEIEARELELVIDAARWRYDIPYWRWRKDGSRGDENGFHGREFDDSSWDVTPHLHPLFHAFYDGRARFRHEFVLPFEQRDQVVTVVLGGMDDEDWTAYRVFLNGEQIATWRGCGRWRDPGAIELAPDDERYALLSFGGSNLLAVEVEGLDRHTPGEQSAEREHYLFQGWLLDQFVATGEPYVVAGDVEVTDVRPGPGSPHAWLEVEGALRDLPGVGVTLSYRAGDRGHLLKTVALRNLGSEPLRLLDVTLEHWLGDFDAKGGGRGQPLLTDRMFLGVEHPAGVNQGEAGRLRALQLPGRVLAPGESFESEPVVLGFAAEGQSVDDAFREYVRRLRPRRRERLTKYSALGWYDFTNPADPLPELTEELVEENLSLLEDLHKRGISFQVYMLDEWWEPMDLAKFRVRTFPSGAAAIGERIRQAGMEPGLWWATTRAVWSSEYAPGVEAAIAGGTGISPARAVLEEEDGQWAWDEEFGAMFTKEKRFCLAAEPYRSMSLQAMAAYVRELGLACMKFDCATLHCTSSEHEHLPGKYSVEPVANTIIEIVAAAERVNPELFVIWYWTFRSPWWLKFGDTMFDKGLKIELGSPATAPAPIYRQSINLHLDQAVRHARLLPLELQDSLGLWWGNIALTNRFGKEEWREAYLLELARGSTLAQFWGDIALLDEDDLRFFADVLEWTRTERPLGATIAIGGDPRLEEPYGYAQRSREAAILTLFNPTFEQGWVRIDAAAVGLRADGLGAYEIYPFPGRVDVAGAELELELKPFEVRCLEVVAAERMPAAIPAQDRPATRATRSLDVAALRRDTQDDTHVARGAIALPELERNDHVVVVARFHRDGVWWYHPDPRTLIDFSARLKQIEVYYEVVPTVRARTGLGSPWILYAIPAGPAWTGEQLDVDMRVRLPAGVSLALEARVYEPWSRRHERRFQPRAAETDLHPGELLGAHVERSK